MEEITKTKKYGITAEDYAIAKNEYELGRAGISDLSARFGISRQSLSERFKKDGCVKGSRAQELMQAVQKKLMVNAEKYAEQRADWIEETRTNGFRSLSTIRKLTTKMLVEAIKASAPIGNDDDNFRALGRANRILVDNIDATMRLLQAEDYVDEAALPSLIIKDLTNEDILKHHIETGALDEGATLDDINLDTSWDDTNGN